jgi:hypothetical protein
MTITVQTDEVTAAVDALHWRGLEKKGYELPSVLAAVVAETERQIRQQWADLDAHTQTSAPEPSAAPEQPLPGPQAPTSAAP